MNQEKLILIKAFIYPFAFVFLTFITANVLITLVCSPQGFSSNAMFFNFLELEHKGRVLSVMFYLCTPLMIGVASSLFVSEMRK